MDPAVRGVYQKTTLRMLAMVRAHPWLRFVFRFTRLHEDCHWLAARACGLQVVEVADTYTRTHGGTFAQRLFTTLGPILPGIVVFPPSFYLLLFGRLPLPALIGCYLAASAAGIWLTGCLGDCVKIWAMFRSIRMEWK